MNFKKYLHFPLHILSFLLVRFKKLITQLKVSNRKAIYKLLAILLLVISICCFVFFLVIRFSISKDIPTNKMLTRVKNPLASELYSNSGQLIAQYYIENRTELDSSDLNPFYRNALLATEDVRFYEHDGVDLKSLFRVFFKTLLLQKQSSGGGSTLTQQLAKNLYPRKPYPTFGIIKNKLREMVIAKRLETIYSKEEILLMYSNTVSFGEKAFGLGTASKRFFNKEPKQLLLEEAAVLVGLLKATSYYSPRKNPKNALKRRNIVLNQMVKYDFIPKKTQEQLSALPLHLNYQPSINKQEFAPYFKEYIKREFNNWSIKNSKPDGSKYDLLKDGLKVHTTIDHNFQIAAEEIMKSHMSKLQQLFLNDWKGGKLYGSSTKIIDDKITKHPDYIKLRNNGKNAKEALHLFNTNSQRELWDWKGYRKKSITKIDSIKHYLSLLHTGILAVEPSSGKIKVWVGGINFNKFQYDNILGARQVGSTFKPIVYLAGLETGITPCDVYVNSLKTYPKYQNWTPRNANGKYGGQLTLKSALTGSVNTVSAQVLFNTGIPKVIETSRKLGITNYLDEVPSIVLGTSDISLLEMVQAYSVFANEGNMVKVTAISYVEDANGTILFDNRKVNTQNVEVVNPEAVKQLNGMLQMVTKAGTGRRLYSDYDINFPVMGKTGTTQNQSDGWFIGFNKQLVIGAWVGASDRRIHFKSLRTGSGGKTALPLVASLFEYANTVTNMEKLTFPDYTLEECNLIEEEENLDSDKRNKNESFHERRRRSQQKNMERYLKKQRRLKKYKKAKGKWKQRFNSLFKKRKK